MSNNTFIKGITNCKLNKRSAPDVKAELLGILEKGESVRILSKTKGSAFEGSDEWYELEGGVFSWAGGINVESEDIKNRQVKVGTSKNIKLRTYLSSCFKNGKLIHPVEYWRLPNYKPEFSYLRKMGGDGVFVGIMDFSLGKISPYVNVIGSSNPGIKPKNDHGAAMAGLSAGNSLLQGLAPAASIVELPVFNKKAKFSLALFEKAINYLNLLNDSQKLVVNISLSKLKENISEELENKLITLARRPNIIVVAAAGTDTQLTGDLIQHPARLNDVLAVGTITKDFWVSNRKQFNSQLNILLPDHKYKSISFRKTTPFVNKGKDSAATAVVSGMIANIISQNQDLSLTPKTISNKLLSFFESDTNIEFFKLLTLINPH